MDTATSVSIRRGRYYVDVENVFKAMFERQELFDPAFVRKILPALQPVMLIVDQQSWQASCRSITAPQQFNRWRQRSKIL